MADIGFQRRPISEEELQRLLDWVRRAAPHREALYLLGADCGLRRAEVVNVRMCELQGDRLFVTQGKGGWRRWVPLTGACIRACLACCELRGSDRPAGFSYSNLGMGVRLDFWRAGLPGDLTFHCLRHRFAMKLVNSGMPLHEVQALLGHSSLQATAAYLHATESRFDRARDALEGREPDGPAPDAGPTLRLVG